jgi:hypothetical protein
MIKNEESVRLKKLMKVIIITGRDSIPEAK